MNENKSWLTVISALAIALTRLQDVAFHIHYTVYNFLHEHVCISQFYRSGVFRSYQCSSSTLTHAMLLTGYGSKSGRKYWTLKNRYDSIDVQSNDAYWHVGLRNTLVVCTLVVCSWGTKWGSSGYMLLSRDNNNHCGIASHSFYPTL